MRVIQPEGQRGSLKWIQQAVECCPHLLQPPRLPAVTWVSPRREDGFAEYRDAAFLDRIGLSHLSEALARFWPARGPQWDALGLTARGPVLVEAKAHVQEFFSPPTKAGAASRQRIEAAFRAVQEDLGLRPGVNWAEVYFQYANRLAFLWWLRQQGIDAELVFASFLNDADIGGPEQAETWHAAFAGADYALGLPARHRLSAHVHHVMPDVRRIVQARGG